MNHLVIGMGEIGKAVRSFAGQRESDTIYTYDVHDKEYPVVPRELMVMHICFPYSSGFIKYVKAYILKYEPRHICIWSTVPIGTTRLLRHKAVHSPVEGKHPELLSSIQTMQRWISSTSAPELNFFDTYFRDLGLRTRKVKHPETTEALKLLSTTKYGVNIVFADYVKKVFEEIGADFELSKQWDKDYNELYWNLHMPQFQKFVLDAPDGVIGGHCIRENAALLEEDYPDDVLDLILEMKGAKDE